MTVFYFYPLSSILIVLSKDSLWFDVTEVFSKVSHLHEFYDNFQLKNRKYSLKAALAVR